MRIANIHVAEGESFVVVDFGEVVFEVVAVAEGFFEELDGYVVLILRPVTHSYLLISLHLLIVQSIPIITIVLQRLKTLNRQINLIQVNQNVPLNLQNRIKQVLHWPVETRELKLVQKRLETVDYLRVEDVLFTFEYSVFLLLKE